MFLSGSHHTGSRRELLHLAEQVLSCPLFRTLTRNASGLAYGLLRGPEPVPGLLIEARTDGVLSLKCASLNNFLSQYFVRAGQTP